MLRNALMILLPVMAPIGAMAGSVDEVTPLSESFNQIGFDTIAREHGVSVFKDERAEVIRLGAEGRFAGPPEKVAQTLLDYDNQVGKLDRLSESRILDRGENWLIVYQRLNLPVIDDRDFNLKVTWGQKDGVYWIHWRTWPQGVAPQPGVVRVTDHQGSWQLKPISDGQLTQARFQVRLDIAGLVPKWMARSGSGDEVPEVFMSVRRMLVERVLFGAKPCKSNSC